MPSRKRSSQDSAGSKKRSKQSASHTATSTAATNDEAVIALSENTRNRQSRRPNGTPTVPIPDEENNLTLQTRQIVDSLTDKLESIVDRKIQQVLGANYKDGLPQTQQMASSPQQNDQTQANVTQQPLQNLAEMQDARIAEGTGNSGCLNSISMQSSPSIPLHASVPIKVKEKIWADEYVDFASAFNKSQDSFNLVISPTGVSSLSPLNSKKFITIEQWTDIFAVFASVYRQKYPDTAEQLAQYSNTVRAIAKSRGNWHFYDVQFRQLRQSHPFSWDSIHHELYMKALNQKQPFRSTGPQAGQSRRTCNKFNRGERCTGCIYQHKCRGCFGNHPHHKCWKRPTDASQANTNANTGQSQSSRSNPPSRYNPAVQGASAFLQAQSNCNKPTSSTGDILQGFETLLNASLAPSTLDTYRRAWKLFHDFSLAYSNGSISLPVSTSILALFVAFLHERAMSSKSITTYLSGISYVHKLSNLPDPSRHFLISSLLKGAQRLSASYDLRLPITVELLDKLVAALKHVCQSHYHEKLFTAMFLFAFNAFSRCSEITSCKASTRQFILQLTDIIFKSGAAEPATVTVTYRFFKHNNGKPHTLSFSHGHTKVSPVRALEDYILIRGQQAGPLFTLTSGLPVPRRLFDKQLASALKFCGIDSKRYKSHSFRIGKATDCALRGFSDAKIRLLGRWNSNAFQKYIRNTEF